MFSVDWSGASYQIIRYSSHILKFAQSVNIFANRCRCWIKGINWIEQLFSNIPGTCQSYFKWIRSCLRSRKEYFQIFMYVADIELDICHQQTLLISDIFSFIVNTSFQIILFTPCTKSSIDIFVVAIFISYHIMPDELNLNINHSSKSKVLFNNSLNS